MKEYLKPVLMTAAAVLVAYAAIRFYEAWDAKRKAAAAAAAAALSAPPTDEAAA